jgi:hypothetical protein
MTAPTDPHPLAGLRFVYDLDVSGRPAPVDRTYFMGVDVGLGAISGTSVYYFRAPPRRRDFVPWNFTDAQVEARRAVLDRWGLGDVEIVRSPLLGPREEPMETWLDRLGSPVRDLDLYPVGGECLTRPFDWMDTRYRGAVVALPDERDPTTTSALAADAGEARPRSIPAWWSTPLYFQVDAETAARQTREYNARLLAAALDPLCPLGQGRLTPELIKLVRAHMTLAYPPR